MDGSLNHDPLRNSNILQGMLNDEVLHHWIFLVGYSYFDSIFLGPTALPPYRLSACLPRSSPASILAPALKPTSFRKTVYRAKLPFCETVKNACFPI